MMKSSEWEYWRQPQRDFQECGSKKDWESLESTDQKPQPEKPGDGGNYVAKPAGSKPPRKENPNLKMDKLNVALGEVAPIYKR